MPHAFSIPTGARKRLGTTVRALHQPAAYPGNEAPEEAIETHMAWVFLTSSHAYKLKKPIQDRLIDYHTAADRRRACRTEVALNRRLAAPVYLGTVPVAHTTRGLRVGGTGPPVDWLVKMRRLPRAQMLDVRIRHGRVQRARVHALAALLTRFYRAARPAHWSQAEYRGRLLANLTAKRTSLQHPRYRLPPRLLRSVAQAQLRWLRTHVAHLEARAPRVVDAHGDLRPEHVCLTSPPLVIDCLEFNAPPARSPLRACLPEPGVPPPWGCVDRPGADRLLPPTERRRCPGPPHFLLRKLPRHRPRRHCRVASG